MAIKLCPLASLPLIVAAWSPDLTGKEDDIYQSRLGEVVTISGRLGHGKFGYVLDGDQVGFYVTNRRQVEAGAPDDSAEVNRYFAKWDQFLDRHVRVTGKLGYFKAPTLPAFKESYPDEMPPARMPDFYYMMLQDSSIEASEEASALGTIIPVVLLAALVVVFLGVALRHRRAADPPPTD